MTEVDCLFCRIAQGLQTEHFIYRDDDIMAFLDIAPIRPGHTQIIPRQHFESFEVLPSPLLAKITGLGQRLARVQKAIYGVDRVAFSFSGNDIPHAHAHVFPMYGKGDMTSLSYIETRPVVWRNPTRPPDSELKDTALQLTTALQRGG